MMRSNLKVLGKAAVAGYLTLLVVACSEEEARFDVSLAASYAPSDPELAEIYDRSCKACHTLVDTGAPLTGDRAAWKLRLDKGMDTLMENVINGSEGMPPLGLCMECGPEQFEALIHFMATLKEDAK